MLEKNRLESITHMRAIQAIYLGGKKFEKKDCRDSFTWDLKTQVEHRASEATTFHGNSLARN